MDARLSAADLVLRAKNDVEKLVADLGELGDIPPIIQHMLMMRILMLVQDYMLSSVDITVSQLEHMMEAEHGQGPSRPANLLN